MRKNELNLQKQRKKMNWKAFFDMKIFRYYFSNQFKEASTYVFLFFILVFSIIGNSSFLISGIPKADTGLGPNNGYGQLSRDLSLIGRFIIRKCLFLLSFVIFIILKVLQLFRDDIQEGIIPVLSSASYFKLKIAVQKWLVIQVIGIIFVVGYFHSLLVGMHSLLYKYFLIVWYRQVLKPIFFSILLQLLIPAVLILFIFSFKKWRTILSFMGCVIFCFSFFIPNMLKANLIQKDPSFTLNHKVKWLHYKKEENFLVEVYNDSELEDLFDFKNWYTDKQVLENDIKVTNWKIQPEPYEKYRFIFKDQFVKKINDALIKSGANIDNTLLTNSIELENIDINDSEFTPLIVKLIIDFYKNNFSSITLKPIKNYDSFLIKSFDKTVLNSIKNLTNKEKKIFDLSVALRQPKYKYIIWDNCKTRSNVFASSLAHQYCKIYPSDQVKEIKAKIEELFTVDHFVDCPVFQSLTFLLENLYKISELTNYFNNNLENPELGVKQLETYFNRLKINHWSNFSCQLTQMFCDLGEFSYLCNYNKYGKWQVEEKKFNQANDNKKTIKYLRLKPNSLRKIVDSDWFYLTFLSFSFLLTIISFIMCKKDFS